MLQRTELPVELQSMLNNLAYMLWNLREDDDHVSNSKGTRHPDDSRADKHAHRVAKYYPRRAAQNPRPTAPRLPSLGQFFPLPSAPAARRTPSRPELPNKVARWL